MDKDTSNFNFGLHLSKLEARILKTADRLPESGALFAIFQRHLESGLARCQGAYTNIEAFPGKLAHQVVEALAFCAEEIRGRYAYIFKDQFRCILCFQAHFIKQATAFEALHA